MSGKTDCTWRKRTYEYIDLQIVLNSLTAKQGAMAEGGGKGKCRIERHTYMKRLSLDLENEIPGAMSMHVNCRDLCDEGTKSSCLDNLHSEVIHKRVGELRLQAN
jgi:hypothetical protein